MAHKSYDHLPEADHKKSRFRMIEGAKKLVHWFIEPPKKPHSHQESNGSISTKLPSSCEPDHGLQSAVNAHRHPKAPVRK